MMRTLTALALLAAFTTPVLATPALAAETTPLKVEQRCGWIANPTPANWWLNDKDAEWTLSEQGGYQAKDLDLPDFSTHDWVVTNSGDHGYGCACITGTFDPKTKRLVRMTRATQRTLAQCKADKGLKPADQ